MSGSPACSQRHGGHSYGPHAATTLLHPASVSDVKTSHAVRVSGRGTPMLRNLDVLDPSLHRLSRMFAVL